MEAVQTASTTNLSFTAVTVRNMLTWTQTEGPAPADLGSYRMISQLVMVREEEPVYQVLLCCMPHWCCI